MTVSDQQDQWANISDYGKQNSTDGMIYWLGITDTYPSGLGCNHGVERFLLGIE